MRCLKIMLSLSVCLGWMVGCDPAVPPKKEKPGHEHTHSHGKHEEHELHLKPGNQHVQWSHDDEAGTVTIRLEEVIAGGAKVDKVRIDVVIKDKKTSYDLAPSSTDSKKLEGSVYTIKSPELVVALDVDGVTKTLVVTADGKELTGSLEHTDEGHDHDHDH